MRNHTDEAIFLAALAIAAASLLIAPGCSDRGGRLARLTFPASSLPKNVSLAPWTGSDKLPWMTSNPFRSTNRRLLSKLEEDLPVDKGHLAEIYLAAYSVGKPDESSVEIGVMGLRFKGPAVASRAAKAMRPKMDENARLEPHTAPSLIHQGSIVCILSHTSAVDKDVWSAMVRLVEKAITNVP